MTNLSYLKALNRALADEMARDPAVCVFGEDIAGRGHATSPPACSSGSARERVLDMPISEQAFTSFATGAAMAGAAAGDRVPDPGAAVPGVRADRQPGPQVLADDRRPDAGAGDLPGAQLRLARPAGPASIPTTPTACSPTSGSRPWCRPRRPTPTACWSRAIRDDDPVIVFAPAGAMGQREDVDFDALAPVPLGVGRVHRPGTDVTVVAVGHLVHDALAVAEELAGDGLGRGVRPAHALPVRLAGTGRLAGAHRPAGGDRRLQPHLRHRRRDPGHRGRGDAPGRAAQAGHPAGRRGAAVRRGRWTGRCSRAGEQLRTAIEAVLKGS